MYMDSPWHQDLAFRILHKYIFPPQPSTTTSILRIDQKFLACFSTHGRGCCHSHPFPLHQLKPPLFLTTGRSSGSHPSRLHYRHLVISAPHFPPTPSSGEWIPLTSSARGSPELAMLIHLVLTLGLICNARVLLWCGLSPQLRNNKFPTLQPKDQHTTNYQNISEVYVACEQENESQNSCSQGRHLVKEWASSPIAQGIKAVI